MLWICSGPAYARLVGWSCSCTSGPTGACFCDSVKKVLHLLLLPPPTGPALAAALSRGKLGWARGLSLELVSYHAYWIDYFSWCHDQVPGRKQFAEGRMYFGSQFRAVWPIIAEKTWRQGWLGPQCWPRSRNRAMVWLSWLTPFSF